MIAGVELRFLLLLFLGVIAIVVALPFLLSVAKQEEEHEHKQETTAHDEEPAKTLTFAEACSPRVEHIAEDDDIEE